MIPDFGVSLSVLIQQAAAVTESNEVTIVTGPAVKQRKILHNINL